MSDTDNPIRCYPGWSNATTYWKERAKRAEQRVCELTRTDREAFIAMLKGAGVVWKNAGDSDHPYQLHTPDGGVMIKQGDGPNNLGYAFFFTIFNFDEAGKLTTVEVWE